MKATISGISKKSIEKLLENSNWFYNTRCLNKNFFNIKIFFWPLPFSFQKLNSGKVCITIYNEDKVTHTIYSQEEYRDKILIPSSLYIKNYSSDTVFIKGEREQIIRLANFIKREFKENNIKLYEES